MTTMCRTCGQQVDQAQALFDKESSVVLYNIFKLTGVLLSDKPGVPTKICLSCLQDLNGAISFRERCIRTNNSWFDNQDTKEDFDVQMEEDISQNELRVIIVPKRSLNQPESSPQNSKKLDGVMSMTIDDPIDRLTAPDATSVDFMDPLRCEDTIQVKVEHLPTDGEPTEKKPKSSTRKKRGRPKEDNKSKAEKYEKRKKLAAEKRAQAKDQKPYFCDQCGKTFSERGNFNVHLTRHKGTKEFQCQECDRREFTQHLLNLHVRVKHRGELPYVCKYCGQRFDNCLKRLFHERKHKESPDHRPHVCSICKKGFKSTTSLRNHSVVHTGEQPFHCELCQTHFNRRNSLRTHYKSKQHVIKAEEQAKQLEVEDDTVPEDG
ncbi:transcription factor Ouib-like isoform X2 [Drosophila takahashii]